MTVKTIAWWKTLLVIFGFPIAYMIYGTTEIAQELFRYKDRDYYYVFWGGIIVLHWLSVFVVWAMLKTSHKNFSDIGYKFKAKGTLWLLCLYLCVAVVALGVTEFLLNMSDLNQDVVKRLPGLVPINLPERIFFILLVLSTGFCEEVVYRGFAITGLSDAGMNRWVALMFAAFLFVGIHGINAYSNRFLFLFGGGVMFGLLYLSTKNLLPSIIVHLAINLSAMLAILQAIE